MLLFYVIAFLFNEISVDGRLDSCRKTFGSNTYDLNQLSHLIIIGQEAPFRYVFTPCGLAPKERCGQSSILPDGMTSCQVRVASGRVDSFESSMGFLDGYGQLPNIEFIENTAGPGTGVIMTVRNAICNQKERLVKAIFTCDRSKKNPTTMQAVESPACVFTYRINSEEACPIPSNGGEGGGTSGGTVFIIIILVLSSVYLIGGISYNYFKNQQRGLAVLPHPSFWLLLFGLFLNGCRFSLNFIRTRGKGTSDNTYNSL